MYSGESAIFLEGLFMREGAQRKQVEPLPPAIAQETLPVLAAPGPISLHSALSINTLLRDMTGQLNGVPVPGAIAAIVRDAALRAASDVDTCWARSLVGDFFKASEPLGLGMEGAGFVAQMEEALIGRLVRDIPGSSLVFSHHRIVSVESAFETMGRRFAPAHVERVTGVLFEHFYQVLREGADHLGHVVRDVDHMIERLEQHLEPDVF